MSGQTVSGEDFGDYPTASIGGVVFNDLNGDGTLESGEPGLSGWTVQPPQQHEQRDRHGHDRHQRHLLLHRACCPGTYTVQVVSQSGTSPRSTAIVRSRTTTARRDTVNFGEFLTVTVSGEVFDDPTESGTFVSGDTGLAGWTVELVQGSQVMQATSAPDGTYSFSNVGPGSYTLEVVQQTGWVATNSPVTITPTSGTNITGEDLGEVQSSTISGQVFNDVAGSGTYAAGDPGLSGWTIDLLNSANHVVASAQTDANGDYTLTGVVPGTYTLEEVPRSGYIQTTAPASYDVTVAQDENLTGYNFGDFQLATVSGTVLDDLNDSGVLNTSDPGLSGWTVEVLNSSNQVIASDTTDSNGLYSFSNLAPGTLHDRGRDPGRIRSDGPGFGFHLDHHLERRTVLGRGLRRLLCPARPAGLYREQYRRRGRGLVPRGD